MYQLKIVILGERENSRAMKDNSMQARLQNLLEIEVVEVLRRLSQNLKRPAKMETMPERAMMKVQTPSTRLMLESPKQRMPKWTMLEAATTKPL